MGHKVLGANIRETEGLLERTSWHSLRVVVVNNPQPKPNKLFVRQNVHRSSQRRVFMNHEFFEPTFATGLEGVAAWCALAVCATKNQRNKNLLWGGYHKQVPWILRSLVQKSLTKLVMLFSKRDLQF